MLGDGYITFILGNGMSYKAVAMERITIGDFEHCEGGNIPGEGACESRDSAMGEEVRRLGMRVLGGLVFQPLTAVARF